MPADTFQSMILGFVVIFSVLGGYVLSLVFRIRHAKKQLNPQTGD